MFPGTLTGIFFSSAIPSNINLGIPRRYFQGFVQICFWVPSLISHVISLKIFRGFFQHSFSWESSRDTMNDSFMVFSRAPPRLFQKSHRRFHQRDRWRTSSELFSKSTPELSPACSLLVLHGFPTGLSFKVPSWRIPRITSYVSPEIPLGVSPGCSQRLLLKFCQGWLQDLLVDFSQDSFQEFCWNSCLILSAISPGLPSGILFGISLRISPGVFPNNSWFLPIITLWRCFFVKCSFYWNLPVDNKFIWRLELWDTKR